MTEAEESERRQKEFEARTKLFMDNLDLDEFFAQLLVSEGFTNLEEVAYVEVDELLVIDGVDEDTASELQARARDVIEAQNKAALEAARALGVEDSLVEFEGLTPQMLEALAKDDVKTLEDFATCADWELAGGWTTDNGERIKDDDVLSPPVAETLFHIPRTCAAAQTQCLFTVCIAHKDRLSFQMGGVRNLTIYTCASHAT